MEKRWADMTPAEKRKVDLLAATKIKRRINKETLEELYALKQTLYQKR